MKPLIGITGAIGYHLLSTEMYHVPQPLQQLNDYYVTCVERAGGIPVILPVFEDPELAKAAVDRVDGVILSGGPDIDPKLYGQRVSAKVGTILPRRDAVDKMVAEYAMKQTNKPLLCVCRGTQMLNVVMGGTLHIDLPETGSLEHRLTMYPRTEYSHEITVTEGTRLAGLIGSGTVGVNSLHHQAVCDVAEGFVVSARSIPDQVIEAIELPGERFVVAVQWHPEELHQSANQQELFRALVREASKSCR